MPNTTFNPRYLGDFASAASGTVLKKNGNSVGFDYASLPLLTGDIRIWNLDAGVYKLDPVLNSCRVFYKGASDTISYTYGNGQILTVSEQNGNKFWKLDFSSISAGGPLFKSYYTNHIIGWTTSTDGSFMSIREPGNGNGGEVSLGTFINSKSVSNFNSTNIEFLVPGQFGGYYKNNNVTNGPEDLDLISGTKFILEVKNASSTISQSTDSGYNARQDLYFPDLNKHFYRIIKFQNNTVVPKTDVHGADANGWVRTLDNVKIKYFEPDTSIMVFQNAVTGNDGNQYDVYDAIVIGTQVWLGKNFLCERTAAGGAISGWSSNFYYANNDSSTYGTYGFVYNQTAALNGASQSTAVPSGVQGIAPNGWHIPSEGEFDVLINYLKAHSEYWSGGNSDYIAKSLCSTTDWNSSSVANTPGNTPLDNNATGFGAKPAGYSNGSTPALFGDAAVFMTTGTKCVVIYKDQTGVIDATTSTITTSMKASVRCLYNGTVQDFRELMMNKGIGTISAVRDNQVLSYNSTDGVWENKDNPLPAATASDAGKFVTVNSSGSYVLETVANAELIQY